MVTDTANAAVGDKIRCDACPVMCYIKPGAAGACDRYANHDGKLVRVDPHVVLERTVSHGGRLVPFQAGGDWDGKIVHEPSMFVTAIGAGTTYPDYKPAPFIVSSAIEGVDMVTVVTEGIFSYCGVKVKIDTDRVLGPETATVRAEREAVGHVTTSEYGSQMLSLGGVHHLTGGSKKEGRVTCDTLMDLSNCKPVELTIDGGATVVVQAGYPPIVNGVPEERMRVGCGSATIGMFAKQWHGKVDEVVVVDVPITCRLSEHHAGRLLDIREAGIKMTRRRSTPGRYFQVAEPGTGWGGTKISDPLSVLGPFDPKTARPGMTMLMVSTTGEHAAYYELDAALRPVEKEMPLDLKLSVERIQENCEPALCTVLFMGGAGGSLRAGVTDNPVRLTRSVKDALTRVTSGGAPVYVWPGGGITFMVDVTQMPAGAFGYVPTPALVAPIAAEEFIRPMAAVAGSVAEEILGSMLAAARLDRAYVNNGGDIALHLAGGEQFTVGLLDRPDRHGLMRTMVIDSSDPVRGVATSGRHGRSFSLGIADAVTVLAKTASQADAAATIIANAVDLPGHPAIVRCPANELQPDSDLGARFVTSDVGALGEQEIEEALEAGARRARQLLSAGLIEGAALRLLGETVVVGARGIAAPHALHRDQIQQAIHA